MSKDDDRLLVDSEGYMKLVAEHARFQGALQMIRVHQLKKIGASDPIYIMSNAALHEEMEQ